MIYDTELLDSLKTTFNSVKATLENQVELQEKLIENLEALNAIYVNKINNYELILKDLKICGLEDNLNCVAVKAFKL